jgi:hypothetical protein
LINDSPRYPTTKARPDRIIAVSAPLDANAVSRVIESNGFRYSEALNWGGIVPKEKIPVTLMGTPGELVAIENGQVSNIRELASCLTSYHIRVETYYDPHFPGHHGSITRDLPLYPDFVAAFERAQDFGG